MLTPTPRRDELRGSRVPQGVVTASDWAWRVLAIAAFAALLWWLLQYFSAVAIPLAVAVLITALLTPLKRLLSRWNWPPALVAVVCLLVLALVVSGILATVGVQIAREWPQLWDQALQGVGVFVAWLASGPLHIDQNQLNDYIHQLNQYISNSREELASTAARAGLGVGHFLAGLAIALIAAFFFLASGRDIWRAVTKLVPEHYQESTARASERGWLSLVAYMRAQVLVALVDALGILIGALALGLPLPLGLFALTFITAFVPVVGAVVAGTVACALALLTHGPVSALIMLGVTVLVMEAEGHFLQPILLGRAVSLHPLAVLVGLVIGSTLSGIVGALLVIPVLAFGTAFIRGLRSEKVEEVVEELPESKE